MCTTISAKPFATIGKAILAARAAGPGARIVLKSGEYRLSRTLKLGKAAMIGLGRGAFAYPDTPNDVINKGAMDPNKCCVTCSRCTQIMRDGEHTGCVIRDAATYAKPYQAAKEHALARLKG